MTEFRIKVAERIAAISAIYPSSRDYCKGYLSEETPEIHVAISPEDIAYEREKSIKTNLAEGNPDTCPSEAQLELTAIQRKIAEELFAYNTVVFHGSAVAVDGAAYLFTAKSGTGKSTHTRLWRQMLGERAVMINDDKPFLRIGEDGVLVCGAPWCGKHRLQTNISMPLKAICILERGEENRIAKISAEEAVFILMQQTNRPMKAAMMPKFLELMDLLAQKTAFYRLRCNMDPEAALVSYTAMSGAESK